jgi:hypothetical protein
MSDTVPDRARPPAYDPRQALRPRNGWTRLRAIGNAPIVKLTIAIPLIGYLVLFNENLLHYMELSRELFGHNRDPPNGVGTAEAYVSWRLLLLYFGLCLVAVASALYGWYCPDEIKLYQLSTDYVASVLRSLSAIGVTRIESALESGDDPARAGLRDWRDVQNSRPTPEDDEQFTARLVESTRGVLDLHFEYLNRSHPLARAATAICYVSGFVALLIPSIDVFGRVVYLVGHLRW